MILIPMTTSTMMIITNHFNHHFFFFLYIQITMFSLVQHSTDIQGTSESGLRHNLPVARLRLTGGPTRGKRLDQREIWRDGLGESKTLLTQLTAESAPTRGETQHPPAHPSDLKVLRGGCARASLTPTFITKLKKIKIMAYAIF